MNSAPPPHSDDPLSAPPPVLGSWRNLYALIIVNLVILIILFLIITKVYS